MSPCQDRTYGEIDGKALLELTKRICRYEKAHAGRPKRVRDLLDLMAPPVGGRTPGERADALERCGSWLEFRHYFTHEDKPTRLHAADFCQQHKLCQFCALLRSARLLRSYLPKVQQTIVCCDTRPYLLTFTQPTGADLAERFRHLIKHYSAWVRDIRLARNGARKMLPASVFAGGVGSIEIKRGEGTRGGGWHVHIHTLVFVNRETNIDTNSILHDWANRVGGDVRAQDLRPLRSVAQAGAGGAAELLLTDGLVKDLCEVFKYPMKFSSMATADLWRSLEVTQNRQLLRAWGAMRGVQVPDDLADSPLTDQDLPYLRLLFRFVRGNYENFRAEFC